jgi:hypothetical protein
MSSSRKLTCYRDFAAYVSQSLYWRYSQSVGCLRPSFLKCCPSKLLSDSTLPPPPFHCVNKYTVLYPGGRGHGVLGLRQINTCRKVPLQVILLMTTFCLAFDESYIFADNCLGMTLAATFKRTPRCRRDFLIPFSALSAYTV